MQPATIGRKLKGNQKTTMMRHEFFTIIKHGVLLVLFANLMAMPAKAQEFDIMQDLATALEHIQNERFGPAAQLLEPLLPFIEMEYGSYNLDNYAPILVMTGTAFFRDGQYEKAGIYTKEAIDIYEHHGISGGVLGVVALRIYGMVNLHAQEFEEAETTILRMIDISESEGFHDDPNFYDIYDDAISLYSAIEDPDKVLGIWYRMLEQLEGHKGRFSFEYALQLYNFGIHLFNIESYEQAKEVLLETLDIERQIMDACSSDMLFTMREISHLYSILEEPDNQIGMLYEIRDCQGQINGTENSDYAAALFNIGNFYSENEMYHEAVGYFEEALTIEREVLDAADLSLQLTLVELGNVYMMMDEHEKAFELYQEAFDIAMQNYGPEEDGFYEAYHLLLDYYEVMDDVEKFLSLRIEAKGFIAEAFGEESAEYALQLYYLGIEYFHYGMYEEAETALLKAAELERGLYGQENEDYQITLLNLYDLYLQMGRYRQSEQALKEAMQIEEALNGTEHATYGDFLFNLGQLYLNMYQNQLGLDTLKQALENTASNLAEDHPDHGLVSFEIGRAYYQMGRYAEAMPWIETSIEHANLTLPEGDEAHGIRMGGLALVLEELGRFSEARELYYAAIEHARTHLGDDYGNLSTRLNNLARLYLDTGRHERALALFNESLGLLEDQLGKSHSTYAVTLANIAATYEAMGRYNEAQGFYTEAMQIQLDTVGEESMEYASTLSNYAGLLVKLGQFQDSLPLFQKSLDLSRSIHEDGHPFISYRLNNLAAVYENLNEFDKAKELYKESIGITEGLYGKSHPDYSINVSNLAGLLRKMGDMERAYGLYLEALETAEAFLGREHPDVAMHLSNLGLMLGFLDRFDEAESHYRESLDITENTLGRSHPSYGHRLDNLGVVYLRAGDLKGATDVFLESLENKKEQIERQFSFLSEREKELYLEQLFFNFELYQNAFLARLESNPELKGVMYDIGLMTRGMVLNASQNMRQVIGQSNDSEALALFGEWLELRSLIARQLGISEARRMDGLEELETEASRMEQQLTRISSGFEGGQRLQSVRWEDIKQALKPGEASIEFVNYFEWQGDGWTQEVQYLAQIIRSDWDQPEIIPLFHQTQLDSLMERRTGSDQDYIAGLYRTIGISVTEGEIPTYGQELHSLIWAPLEAYLDGIGTVYFAPSGSLHQVSFAALPMDEGTLLSDRYHLRQLSTTAHIALDAGPEASIPESIALFGGIDYDAGPEQLLAAASGVNGTGTAEQTDRIELPDGAVRGGAWGYLPGTLAEAEAILEASGDLRHGIRFFSGHEAIEERFKGLAGSNSPEILHIATHGFFFPDPARSPEAYRFEGLGDWYAANQSSGNPLSRSGLLFAGGNRTWAGQPMPDGLEDGILTALEVSNLYFPNTLLAVLSACETGLGEIHGSEGVFGLQRAFKMAGVDYLLMSLWKVPDNETAEFMTLFYESLFAGNAIRAAFHEAQQEMKTRYRDEPFKWAAFVLVR